MKDIIETMNGSQIGNIRLPLEVVTSVQLPTSQHNNTPSTQTIFSLSRCPLVTSTLASTNPAILFSTPTTTLAPMYETSFALPGCNQNDKLVCTTAHVSKTGISGIVEADINRDPLQRGSTILAPVEKPLNRTVLLTALPAYNPNNAGDLCNNAGLLESHLLQMAPTLPMTSIAISSTPTPSIEMMEWSTQPTSKTVMRV